MTKKKLFSLILTPTILCSAAPVIITGCSDTKDNKKQTNAIFDKDYFSQDSTIFNPSLATFSAYTNSESMTYLENDNYSQGYKNIKDFWELFGFTNFAANDDYVIKPTTDTFGCAAAQMKLDDDTTLISLVGTSIIYEKEWASNFTLQSANDPIWYHSGFYEASQKELNFLKTYIQQNNITGNIKLWITGYSRASATANLTAATLDQKIKIIQLMKSSVTKQI